jgi:hypothetical protein
MTTTGPVTLTDVPSLSMGRHVTVRRGPMGHIVLTLTCDGVPVEEVALSDTQAADVADGLRALVLQAEECRAAGREVAA